MKAVIKLDVPEYQIGQKVSIYFPDTMVKHAICEAVKERKRPERLLPCTCGCKRREHWYGSKVEMKTAVIIICIFVFVAIIIALALLISKWVWSLDIPEWLKILLIIK